MAKAIFWRYGLVGLILSMAVGIAIYFAVGLGLFAYYNATVGLPQRETVSIHPVLGAALFGVPALGALVANYFILKWALSSLYGKNFGGMTFLLTNVSNDKDLADAN